MQEYEKKAIKISSVSIIGNILLFVFKFIAGIVGHSSAMVSDAIHSLSDVFTSIIVIIGVKVASQKADDKHPYGHERFESVAAIILSVILFITGFEIGIGSFKQILYLRNTSLSDIENMVLPGFIAIVGAIVSIVIKESMFWYTRYYAKQINSDSLMADAWHHRTDSLSSIGALIGILVARQGYVICDVVVGFIICLFIIEASVKIFRDAIDKMVDCCCNYELEQQMLECIKNQKGVLGVDLIHTRIFGNRIYVDVEIQADGNLTLREGHEIAEKVHDIIEKEFNAVKHVMVHVNPI